MLILIAVTIRVAINSGLFGHAKNATDGWKTEEERESNIGNDNQINDIVNQYAGGTSGKQGHPLGGIRVTENTEYSSDGKTAIIPAKFTASGLESEQSIDEGLVIYLIPEGTTVDWKNAEKVETAQRTYDQFVWIPISDINDMYMCQSEDGTKSCNITVVDGKAKCTTHNSDNMAGRLYGTGLGETFDSSLTNQKYTANTGLREPDVLPEYDNDDYRSLSLINRMLGTSYTSENFKQALQEEYNEIVKSVYENHGFYVARYETSEITTNNGTKIKFVAGAKPALFSPWHENYAKQRAYTINNELEVGSTLIQGAAYDQVMKFVNTTNYDVKAKTNVGHNYKDFTFTQGYGYKYQTGGRDYSTIYKGTIEYNDVSKNIFDLEGNVMVWTTEASGTDLRLSRGGCCNPNRGSNNSASYRDHGEYSGPFVYRYFS